MNFGRICVSGELGRVGVSRKLIACHTPRIVTRYKHPEGRNLPKSPTARLLPKSPGSPNPSEVPWETKSSLTHCFRLKNLPKVHGGPNPLHAGHLRRRHSRVVVVVAITPSPLETPLQNPEVTPITSLRHEMHIIQHKAS